MGRLDGKVAMIFGAGPNFGGTIAHFMGKEGAKIAVADIRQAAADDTAAFLEGRGIDAVALTAEASDEASVERAVKQAVDHYGYIDTVVNLAGTMRRGAVYEMKLEDWEAQLKSFLTAGFITTKHTSRAMMDKKRPGCIIHLLSTAAHFGEANHAGYCACKAGLMNFARSAAMDLAFAKIRVNTITPYAMEHNLWQNMIEETTSEAVRPPLTRYSYSRDDVLKLVPLERFPRASDIAWAAVYLASNEAQFLTGVDIPVDGGIRVKYPSWRPGDYNGVTIEGYLDQLHVTRYGEPQESFEEFVQKRAPGEKA